MGLTIKAVRGGWAVYSCGMRITATMKKGEAVKVRRHMMRELRAAA